MDESILLHLKQLKDELSLTSCNLPVALQF